MSCVSSQLYPFALRCHRGKPCAQRISLQTIPLRDLQNQRIPHADISRALETGSHHGAQQCGRYLMAVPLAGRNYDANGIVIRSGTGDGNIWDTAGSVVPEEPELSPCFYGSLGWNRTNDQRINSPTLYR